ncbi:hypothetical protein [Amycolatopsis sp. NPDC051071]|uniref:hypothetical protein n=1 Tax=Amycolatopsis sp. NPDC051071 TaxID=3154637 RepID=UPI00344AFCC5
MTETGEVAEALRTGPFCHALTVTARDRGLSLRQLQYRLRAKGTSLSAMTLSYWQSGRSKPEREESLQAVGILEQVLALDPGSLLRLLGSPRPRGRGVRSVKPGDRLHRAWGHPAFLPPLLAEFRDSVGNPVRKIGLRESFSVGPDHCVRRIVVRELIEARRDRTRTMLIAARSEPGVPPPQVTSSSHCHPGAVLTLADEGFSMTELVLARTLRRGERLVIGYEQEFPRPLVTRRHHRRIAEPVDVYHGRFVFTRDAEPVACRTWRTRTPEGRTTGWQETRPDERHTVHVSRRNAAPGIHGLHWSWE